jgi:RHS repeat-associated protein
MGLQSTSFVGFAQTTLGTNVVTITATDYSSNSRTNRYQVVITNNSVARTLTYDLNGNETSAITATSTNTYEWDAADRLVAINSGINRSEFTYDGLGRRTKIVEKLNGVAQNTNLFLWCGTGLCEQRDSTGGNVSRRFFGGGEQIAGTNYFFTRDHLGSVREMTDATGAIRTRYEYDPYGRRTKVSGDLDADFAFTGHYYHPMSGLSLTLYRAYDTETGRWLSRDPNRERGGLNLYAYVANNPINLFDTLGLDYLKNNTGLPVIVYGNPGPGHGTADYNMYGIQPPNGEFTGPIAGWRDPEDARKAQANAIMDAQCLEGPREYVPPADNTISGLIDDVDGYFDFDGNQHRLRGDEYGPRTTLSLDENGQIVTSREFLSVIGAYVRYGFRRVGELSDKLSGRLGDLFIRLGTLF